MDTNTKTVSEMANNASGQPELPDLTSPDVINRLYTAYLPKVSTDVNKWPASHAAILADVRNSSPQQIASPEFQSRLWKDNPVSSSGACSVSMNEVMKNRELAEWIGNTAKMSLPPLGSDRIRALETIYDELCMRVKSLTSKMPWLLILRVMATLFPEDYSNVTSEFRLRKVGRAMFGGLSKAERESTTLLSAHILNRLTEILGPTNGTPEQLALRGEFVWFLWESIDVNKEADLPEDSNNDGSDTNEKLEFLPVTRRLRGVSPIPDPMGTVFETVEFVSRNHATRGAVVEYIVGQHPNVQKNSASQYLNCMWNTLGMFQLNGETLELTAAAKLFLNSENPDILIRPLLTKAIGPDLVLWRLSQQGPTARMDLIKALQNHYRRWTSQFMPTSILSWGRSFDLWAAKPDGKYALTERGKKWAARMKSEPHPVLAIAETDDGEEEIEIEPDKYVAPSLAELLSAFQKGLLVISDDVVIRLHAALHASDSKHFVLLSGLSGTGKTQIAINYANAYHRIEQGKVNPYLQLISVEPDWTDSTGLLGYVNPLGGEASYVRKECLKFLLLAHEHPGVPYFLCLDEMNIARVEYYFAPFLSAMETGGSLVFHYEDQPIDDVPPFIPWPQNLYIFGTVNMDETTHAFSDKVLDRAFTIEFWEVDLDQYAQRFANNNRHKDYPTELLQEVIGILKEVASFLKAIHQHFGYRTAEEVLGFMRACGDSLPHAKAIDQAIFMKVLPKIRGQDTEPMRHSLDELRKWAEHREYVITAEKVRSMLAELRNTGTTRFWR